MYTYTYYNPSLYPSLPHKIILGQQLLAMHPICYDILPIPSVVVRGLRIGDYSVHTAICLKTVPSAYN